MVKCFNNTGLKINSLDDVNVNKVEIIKMENLVPNFLGVLEKHNINLTDSATTKLKEKKKSNTSKHLNYREYYDEECIELVRQKDRLIIDLFKYEF